MSLFLTPLASCFTQSSRSAARSCFAVFAACSFMLGAIDVSEIADPQADLVRAVHDGDLAATKVALDKGANPNLPGEFNRTVLHRAAQYGEEEMIELLLVRGANPNVRDNDGRAPLHLANTMSAPILLRHKADAMIRDNRGNTVMHTAAEDQGARLCSIMKNAGVPVDARNSFGASPLHFAAMQGYVNVAEYLLEMGADVNAKTTGKGVYKWTYIAWDALGNDEAVDAGATPLSLAKKKHKQNRWTTSRYDEFAKFLKSKGGK